MLKIKKIENFSNLIILLLLINFSGNVSGAEITWIGGDGEWEIASNWDLGQVPTSNDIVVINSGHVTVENLCHASRIELDGGQLTVAEFGTLLLEPEIVGPGTGRILMIDYDGIFINEGTTMFLWDGQNVSTSATCFIENEGTLKNKASGYIYMTGSDFDGIDHDSDIPFTNNGIIEMDNLKEGISASEIIYNYGSIYMNNVRSGIVSFEKFFNYGRIDVSSSGFSVDAYNNLFMGSSAVLNCNNTLAIEASAFLDNYGEINLETDLTTANALIIGGRLDMQINGSININGSFAKGIEIYYSDSEVYNSGDIEIALAEPSSIGIVNSGILVNNHGGNITCASYNEHGDYSDGKCNNYGTWRFKNDLEGPNGTLSIEGTVTNENYGKLYLEGRLSLPAGSSIKNEGHMFVTSNISQPFIEGRINNTGMLNDVYGKLDDVDNRSIIARPVLYSSRIKNALDLGSQPEVTILAWYTTETGTASAGSYDSKTNIYNPNKHASKLNSVFVLTMLNSNNSEQRHEVKFKKSINSEFSSNEFNTKDFGIADYDVLAFPNPTAEVLNIESRNATIGDSFDTRLINLQGITIAMQNCNDNCQIEIPKDLVNGIYFLSIEKNGLPLQALEQIRVFR